MQDYSTPYHLAYALAVVVYGGYAIWLWRRVKRVRRRLETLASEAGRFISKST